MKRTDLPTIATAANFRNGWAPAPLMAIVRQMERVYACVNTCAGSIEALHAPVADRRINRLAADAAMRTRLRHQRVVTKLVR